MTIIGKQKPGGFTGREQIKTIDINGITYVGTLQEIADLGGGGFTPVDGNGTAVNGNAIDIGGTLAQTTAILGAGEIFRVGIASSRTGLQEFYASTIRLDTSAEILFDATTYVRFVSADVRMEAISTSDPGVVGRLWNSSGDLRISAGGGGPCITGDALISTDKVTAVLFEDLIPNTKVLTRNSITKEQEIQEFKEIIVKENIQIVYISLDNDTVLKSTPAHPWRSENGWVSFDTAGCLQYYGIEAKAINIGTKLLTKEETYAEVLSLNNVTEGKQLTYHLKGIVNGNYYANGILTASMK